MHLNTVIIFRTGIDTLLDIVMQGQQSTFLFSLISPWLGYDLDIQTCADKLRSALPCTLKLAYISPVCMYCYFSW